MVKVSPPRFYVEINKKFDITCKSGRPNFISGSFSNFALFFLEYRKITVFLRIIRRKNYLLLGKIIKFGQIVLKASSHKTELYLRHFLRFRPQTQNRIFDVP